ncbi:ABC transporter ATP-binding protein [Geobacter sulfurreducens]|uniref:ABC transporter ATP-binding protein n=1 Tax=Geobacter sulfurreducens TaxID=35554 RepID=UPI0020B644AC|nr:ABC transporter ATP-binding protein [Geobacter sulfurreducens]UTG94147.1 ABC transporter ATP-binding protein [Geobacter sulfurreducens]
MSNVISVENLGKKYLISHQGREPYTALRDVLTDGARAFYRRLFSPGTSQADAQAEEFWALKDVSFEVKQGDRIGIIGRNGAGKSTLLKILSRITEPTEGRVRIRGRIASLLEVGTGFHPELTGRENIFLNGAILGMNRAEIARKFDEIVAFAEIEKFLDTPVKRYSSGMYVRLAFAVAAHLEPEILVVDEVLAVGDAQFQNKCLGKMEDVSTREGRTVLFVTHNLPALQALCTRAIVIEKGHIEFTGDVDVAIHHYLHNEHAAFMRLECSEGNRFLHVSTVDEGGTQRQTFTQSDKVFLKVRVNVECQANLHCGITLFNSSNIPLLSSCVLDTFGEMHAGVSSYSLQIPVELLHSGTYRVEGAIWDHHRVYDKSDCLCSFNVIRGDSVLEAKGTDSRGYLRFPCGWQHESV